MRNNEHRHLSAKLPFIFAVLMVVMVASYEWKISNLKEQIRLLSSQQITSKKPETESSPNEGNEKSSEAAKGAYYPPVSNSGQAVAAKTAPQHKQAQQTQQAAIKELFQSPQDTSTKDSAIDATKTRYEELLVTYLFLKKCGIAKPSDYQKINTSMQNALVSLKAPSRLKYDILTAAKGSYDELYARTSCDSMNLEPTVKRYQEYMNKKSL